MYIQWLAEIDKSNWFNRFAEFPMNPNRKYENESKIFFRREWYGFFNTSEADNIVKLTGHLSWSMRVRSFFAAPFLSFSVSLSLTHSLCSVYIFSMIRMVASMCTVVRQCGRRRRWWRMKHEKMCIFMWFTLSEMNQTLLSVPWQQTAHNGRAIRWQLVREQANKRAFRRGRDAESESEHRSYWGYPMRVVSQRNTEPTSSMYMNRIPDTLRNITQAIQATWLGIAIVTTTHSLSLLLSLCMSYVIYSYNIIA